MIYDENIHRRITAVPHGVVLIKWFYVTRIWQLVCSTIRERRGAHIPRFRVHWLDQVNRNVIKNAM